MMISCYTNAKLVQVEHETKISNTKGIKTIVHSHNEFGIDLWVAPLIQLIISKQQAVLIFHKIRNLLNWIKGNL